VKRTVPALGDQQGRIKMGLREYYHNDHLTRKQGALEAEERLRNAAPELLKLLKDMCAVCRDPSGGTDWDLVAEAEFAIAKAEGK
jgi:hypothetical protein